MLISKHFDYIIGFVESVVTSLKIGNVKVNWLPSFNYGRPIRYIIIHGTGCQNDSFVIKKFRDKNSEVSCHYFISSEGKLYKFVREKDIAWHAGESSWGCDKSLNFTSIGIELFNSTQGVEIPYAEKQYETLIKLLKYLVKKYNIAVENILGHCDIAPNRKIDPGKLFDWKRVKKELENIS